MKQTVPAVALALILAGCSSPTGTDRAPAYFEALRPVATEVTSAVAEVGRVFDGAYESQTNRATRLTDLRAGLDLAIAADRADRLEPGSAYEADHERYLQTIADIRAIYRTFDEAVATEDIAQAAAAAAWMEAAAGLGFAGLTPEYCARVTFDMTLCDRPEEPGEYEASLFTVFLEIAAGYIPLMRVAPPALDADEALRYLALVNMSAADRLWAIATRLDAVEPPADLAADHGVVTDMVREAAVAHGLGGEHRGLEEVFCSAAERLSDQTRQLGSVLFDDDDLSCGA